MPYVERDGTGSIKGIYACPQPGYAEELVADEEAVFPVIIIDDLARLNAVLSEQGSVVRALAEVIFAEINKLRVKGGDPAYTKQQFIAALKAKMRDG